MAKYSLVGGTTSKIAQLFIQDSSSTTGAGLAGLTNNSSGLKCHYIRDKDSASVAVAITSAAIGTFTSGGFIEVESSAMPGVYQFGVPNAAVSANATSVIFYMFGATNMAPLPFELEITKTDNQDAVRGGMTALPNAAAQAANGLPTAGTGAFQISTSAGMVLVQRGSAAGQIDATSGIVNSNLTQTLGVTITSSAGYVPIDWGVMVNKTAAIALTNTTISVTQTVSAVTAGVNINGTSSLVESYASAGNPLTLAQSLYGITQLLSQKSISGTTLTTKKRDGSTTAKVYTLDSATLPTSISETT